MRGITRGLGVRCPFCHVGEEGADLSTFDFASDEKPTKKTARIMIGMLADTNAKLASVGEKPAGEPRSRATPATADSRSRSAPRHSNPVDNRVVGIEVSF